MQTLNQDIKDKTFRRVYLLFGDEPFLVNSYKKRLREARSTLFPYTTLFRSC